MSLLVKFMESDLQTDSESIINNNLYLKAKKKFCDTEKIVNITELSESTKKEVKFKCGFFHYFIKANLIF